MKRVSTNTNHGLTMTILKKMMTMKGRHVISKISDLSRACIQVSIEGMRQGF